MLPHHILERTSRARPEYLLFLPEPIGMSQISGDIATGRKEEKGVGEEPNEDMKNNYADARKIQSMMISSV